MPKPLKTVLKIIIPLVALTAICFAAFIIFINTYHFEYNDISGIGSFSNDEEYEQAQQLISNGYCISYPQFHNSTRFSLQTLNEREVYGAINGKLCTFATNIAAEYKNYAKLDYTVDIKSNDTLTVIFSGTGYFYDGSDPVPINKTFVFDIKNISKDKLPRLIEDESPTDDELDREFDTIHTDFNEAISGCFSVVSARCDGLVSDSEELREYEFTLENVICGEKMPETFHVTMPKGSFNCEDGSRFTSADMIYKTNSSYFLPLKKDSSVFYDYDLYYPVAQIFAELDESGSFIDPKIQGRDLTEAKSLTDFADFVKNRAVTCAQPEDEIGTPFTRSENLSEIISATEYILEVEIDSINYNFADDRTTYKCNIIDRLKANNDKDKWLLAVLPKDCAEVGEKYLLLLNRCGEDSYLFVISSRDYSVYPADSDQANEIGSLLK